MGGTPHKSPDVSGRREQLVALCAALPGAEAERGGAQHLAFRVKKRIFAYYVYDHHRDGRIALLCKAAPGEQQRLVEADPGRYFVPPHVGPKGWVGLRLDSPRVNWKAVKDLVFAAYFLTAPDKVSKQSGGSRPDRVTSLRGGTDLRLRIVVFHPPADVAFAVQEGRSALLRPTEVKKDLIFEFSVRLGKPIPADQPNFLGSFVQGPRGGRFVYVNSGKRAGQNDSCWDRRAKVPLGGLTWALVNSAQRKRGAVIEARMDGGGGDGGPACGSVALVGAWQVVAS